MNHDYDFQRRFHTIIRALNYINMMEKTVRRMERRARRNEATGRGHRNFVEMDQMIDHLRRMLTDLRTMTHARLEQEYRNLAENFDVLHHHGRGARQEDPMAQN
ncbi:unnamed protein product [Caenorhabditis nigoni]